MQRTGISVCIITRDEEDNIEECLESVRWADELIVLDSFSRDKTVEISKRYTDKVFQSEWQGFSKSKNLCVEKASCEWILNIDADERVSEELRDEIIKELAAPNSDGYYIPRENYFLGRCIRHCGWYPDYNLRLFKKENGRFRERAVHESVALNGRVGYLKGHLKHWTYKTIKDYINRLNLYTDLSIEELLKSRFKPPFTLRLKIKLLINMIFSPGFTFSKMFFLRLGFLDGTYGFVISYLYCSYTFVKYAKLWEKIHGGLAG